MSTSFAMTLDTPHAETATAAPIRPRPLMASSVSTSVPASRHVTGATRCYISFWARKLRRPGSEPASDRGSGRLGPGWRRSDRLGFLVEDAGADVEDSAETSSARADLLQDLRLGRFRPRSIWLRYGLRRRRGRRVSERRVRPGGAVHGCTHRGRRRRVEDRVARGLQQ